MTEYQELIAFLGRQFEAIDRRFDGVTERFEAIDRRFDAVDAKLAEHDERFRDVLGHFDELYRRLERLEDGSHLVHRMVRRIEGLLLDRTARWEQLHAVSRN